MTDFYKTKCFVNPPSVRPTRWGICEALRFITIRHMGIVLALKKNFGFPQPTKVFLPHRECSTEKNPSFLLCFKFIIEMFRKLMKMDFSGVWARHTASTSIRLKGPGGPGPGPGPPTTSGLPGRLSAPPERSMRPQAALTESSDPAAARLCCWPGPPH